MRVPRARAAKAVDVQSADSPRPTAETTTTVTSTATGTLIKRQAAADQLGVSYTQMKRIEKTDLPPTLLDGINYHSTEKLLEFKLRQTRTVKGDAGIDGDVTAAAFTAFDSGAGPADVVISLRLPANVVTELHRQWANLRGGFFVDGETANRLERLAAAQDDEHLTDGASLVALLKNLDVDLCESCTRRPARVCLGCYGYRPRRAEQLFAMAKAASEQRAKERDQRFTQKEVAGRARSIAERRRESPVRTQTPTAPRSEGSPNVEGPPKADDK